MLSVQILRASEWLGVAACVVLGVALIVVLAAIRFPGFRVFIAWSTAVYMRPERFDEGSYLHDIAWGMQHWLKTNRLPRVPTRTETLPPMETARLPFKLLGSSRAYETFLVEPPGCIVKRSLSATGDRLLRREAKIIRNLRHAATGTSYQRYLPTSMRVPTDVPAPQSVSAESFAYQANCFAEHWYSVIQINRVYPDGLPAHHVAWMFNRILEILGFVHRQGVVHCAILPQHLWFNTETHALRLVDWTHAKKRGRQVTFVPRRYRMWYPHHTQLTACPGLDIYMAAECMRFLAGGDLEFKKIPPELPRPMRQLLKACLLHSPRMRPQDAWELHRDARDLFACVFGPPAFHRLSMFHQRS